MSSSNIGMGKGFYIEYHEIIIKRKWIIIALFLLFVIASIMFSLSLPKVYRGEAVIKLTLKDYTAKDAGIDKDNMPGHGINARELLGLLGKITKEKIENYDIKINSAVLSDIQLTPIQDNPDKLLLTVDATDRQAISGIMAQVVEYILSNPFVKRSIEQEKSQLKLKLDELSKTISFVGDLPAEYEKLFVVGKTTHGVNPVELRKSINDLQRDKNVLEQTLNDIKGVEIISKPYIPVKPIKPQKKFIVGIAGIVGLLVGIFAAVAIELTSKSRKVLA